MLVDDGSVPEFARYGGYVTVGDRMRFFTNEATADEVKAHPYLGQKRGETEVGKHLPATRRNIDDLVWPLEALAASPMGRNHMLLATWTVGYWGLLLATRWIQGEAIWEGPGRWIMAGLAVLGSGLLGITGTLGGHLIGTYTDVNVLRLLGWEVYTTFYVPTLTVVAIASAAVVLLVIGVWGGRQTLADGTKVPPAEDWVTAQPKGGKPADRPTTGRKREVPPVA